VSVAAAATPAQYPALGQPSLCAAFQLTAAAHPERPALRTALQDDALTWAEYAERVRSVATGLAALGVRAGDTVGLMLANRTEFHLADVAALHLGAAPFSIYNTNPPEKIVPLIENSGTRIVVTEPAFADRVAAVAERMPQIEHVVVAGPDAGPGTLTLAELEALPAPAGFDFDAAWRAVGPDTLATIIYTSGTTGEPKGAEWTHGALLFHCGAMHRSAPVGPAGHVISHLPMAHAAERYTSHYQSLTFGYTITSCPDPKRFAEVLAEVHPTRLFGVPRHYEKLAEAVRSLASADPALEEALAAALERQRGSDAPVDFHTAAQTPEAVALRPVREQLGLDRIEWLTSGGAGTRRDILELFAAIGLPIVELWGMTETLLMLSNDPRAIRIGTVGRPVPGTEARLADDGELLVRGPMFSRYRKDPERTRETLGEDGWMRSGDVAAVDEHGVYRIVDRKKELIITSQGKNLAPALIETTIKQQSPVIAHPVVIGEARPYVTALVVLDEEGVREFAAGRGLTGTHAELVRSDAVQAEVRRAIDAANERLSRAEQVKRFTVLDATWTPGDEEITPTLKLKRRVIADRYAAEIDQLYA
jgi:long-subunit acyl-CoA synthetase (AMP-forming)